MRKIFQPLILLCIMFISGCSTSIYNDSVYENTPLKEYLDLDFISVHKLFFESPLTDIQKKESWENGYQGKYVRWMGFVYEIKKEMLGSKYILYVKATPIDQFTIFPDAYVQMKQTENHKLDEYYKGQPIYFEGKLESMINFGGIFLLTEGVILEEPRNEDTAKATSATTAKVMTTMTTTTEQLIIKSANLTIDKIQVTLANLYPTRVTVRNTGNVGIEPKFDIYVYKGGKEVCSGSSLFSDFSYIEPHQKQTGEITLFGCILYEDGEYELRVDVLDGKYNRLDSVSKNFNIDYWNKFDITLPSSTSLTKQKTTTTLATPTTTFSQITPTSTTTTRTSTTLEIEQFPYPVTMQNSFRFSECINPKMGSLALRSPVRISNINTTGTQLEVLFHVGFGECSDMPYMNSDWKESYEGENIGKIEVVYEDGDKDTFNVKWRVNIDDWVFCRDLPGASKEIWNNECDYRFRNTLQEKIVKHIDLFVGQGIYPPGELSFAIKEVKVT